MGRVASHVRLGGGKNSSRVIDSRANWEENCIRIVNK